MEGWKQREASIVVVIGQIVSLLTIDHVVEHGLPVRYVRVR